MSFRVAGMSPAATQEALGAAGFCLSVGDYYAYEYFQLMGLRDSGGAVRASIYHYNTADEVDRLLGELDALAEQRGENGRMSTLVEDNPAKHRFEILVDDALAGFTAYLPRGEVLVFTHTEVDRGFQGKGVGGALIRGTLDQVRAPAAARWCRSARSWPRSSTSTPSTPTWSPTCRRRGRPAQRAPVSTSAAACRWPGSRRGWPGAPRPVTSSGTPSSTTTASGRAASARCTAARIQSCRCRSRTTRTSGRPPAPARRSAGTSGSA